MSQFLFLSPVALVLDIDENGPSEIWKQVKPPFLPRDFNFSFRCSTVYEEINSFKKSWVNHKFFSKNHDPCPCSIFVACRNIVSNNFCPKWKWMIEKTIFYLRRITCVLFWPQLICQTGTLGTPFPSNHQLRVISQRTYTYVQPNKFKTISNKGHT